MRIPKTRVQSAGRISATLEGIADAFRRTHPQLEPRWIYDPKHKPELSGTMSRLAMGYSFVTWGQFDSAGLARPPEAKDDESVRVADSVLMAVPVEIKRELERENAERAAEELRRVDRQYYEAIEGLGQKLDDRHKPRPRGTAVIEEREYEFDYTQREGGE